MFELETFLQLGTMKEKPLVIAGKKTAVNRSGASYTPPVTVWELIFQNHLLN